MTELEALTHRRLAHHAGYDVPWDDADEARYQTLAGPIGPSLGEAPHDPTRCDRGGQPHLGPCVEPGTCTPGTSAEDRPNPEPHRAAPPQRTDEERAILDHLREQAARMRPRQAVRETRLVGRARNHIPREAS